MGVTGVAKSDAVNAVLGYDILLPSHSGWLSGATKTPAYLKYNEGTDPNEEFVCEIEFHSETDLHHNINVAQQSRLPYYTNPDEERTKLIWP